VSDRALLEMAREFAKPLGGEIPSTDFQAPEKFQKPT